MTAVAHLLLLIQIGTGSITGTLRDLATGEPLAGAVVTVVDLDRTTLTDADGRYRFAPLPPGSHTLLVRRIGYAPRTLEALVPQDGAVELTIALRAEPIVLGAIDGVDVEAESPAADRRVVVASLRDHPLLAEPDVFQALAGGIVTLQPEAPSGVHVRGGGSDQVAYLIDGVPVFSPYHSGETFSAWNADALATMDLRTASETWDALSGVVAAATRVPGDRHHAQAGFSTTQMRVTLDGPLGSSGAGYLYSERSAFPGFPSPQRESTYVRGDAGDRLAKLEVPLAAGRLRLIGYESENEIDALGAASTRNTFAWQSRSVGGEWSRTSSRGSLHMRFWSATGSANALWHPSDSTAEQLTAQRNDVGLSLSLARVGRKGQTTLGVRTQTSRTAYRVATSRETEAPLGALFVERSQHLGASVQLAASLGATASRGAARLSPRTSLAWRAAPGLVVSGQYARLHQFAQSLRNAESVAGAVFPADLFVGAAGAGVPVARSDQGIVAAEYRPTAGLRLAAEAYVREFRDLILVAPRSADPFATDAFTVGAGAARGIAVELNATGARYSAVASYSRQHVRLKDGQRAYVPEYGAAHAVDAGVMVRPSRSISFRLGASGRFGRRGTPLRTPFEWESCNLADRGCEFAGSPRGATDSLGAARLPGYIRLDFGVRGKWRLRVAGRATELALFGTLTNILAHTNVLTTAPDLNTGPGTAVTMRSRVPLVIGVDWAF